MQNGMQSSAEMKYLEFHAYHQTKPNIQLAQLSSLSYSSLKTKSKLYTRREDNPLTRRSWVRVMLCDEEMSTLYFT